MLEGVLDWLRTKRDPLRGEHSAARWAATVSSRDRDDIQRRVVETVGTFPSQKKRVVPEHFDALIKVDERVEGVVAELEAHFIAGYGISAEEETRLWRSVFELTRVLLAAYQHTMKAVGRSGDRDWSPRLPMLLARLVHYKSLDARLRLYRYGRWSPAQWREMHQLYEAARARRWHHRRLAFGEGAAARELPGIEETYVRTLLEQRMDSGNFTPDQVAWVAERLQAWAEGLRLEARRRASAWFFVDPAGSAGLRRVSGPVPMSRVLYLAPGKVLERIEQRLIELQHVGDSIAAPGELPPAEQRLVLRRLHGLFSAETIASVARAERESMEQPVRVLLGRDAIADELRRIEAATTAGAAVEPPALAGLMTAAGTAAVWRIADRSRTGFRLLAPDFAPARIGHLVALEVSGAWRIGVVRRMVRLETDEITFGVEVLGHRAVAVRVAESEASGAPVVGHRADAGRPSAADAVKARSEASAIYLPASPDNRDPLLKSIIVPEAFARPGKVLSLAHGDSRYLVRLGGRVDGYGTWVLAAIESAQEL